MIRLSATVLEAYRRVVQTEFAEELELIRQIKGEYVSPRWQMNVGAAWHQGLEAMAHGWAPADDYTIQGFRFAKTNMKTAVLDIGPGLWEVKSTKVMDVGMPVRIVCKADHVHGLTLNEVKCRFSPCDPADYQDSLQWRLYLWAHEAAVLRYHLFHFDEPDKEGKVKFKDSLAFNCWPYVGMEEDCKRWVGAFLDWAQRRRLMEYLEKLGTTPGLEEAA